MILQALTFAMHVLVHAYGPAGRVVAYLMPSFRNMASKAIQNNKGKNFNSKHLKRGDPLPPFNGIPRVYNMRYCPYAQRAILALNAKNINYDVVNCNLVDKPEWLFEKSDFAKVPALEIEEGTTICESLIVADYVDEVYPQRKLLPADPLRRAQDQMLIQRMEAIQGVMFKTLKMPDKLTDENIESAIKSLDKIQETLEKRGTKFLHSDEQPGYVDYMIWPWFERLPLVITLMNNNKINLDQVKYKRLLSYIEEMKKDPVVKEYIIDEETYRKFFKGYMTGEVRYDFMDDK